MAREAAEFKEQHGDKSSHSLAGASRLHRLAIRVLNDMGGKFDPVMYDWLLELHGVNDPEILYYVMQAVLEGHDTNQS